MCYGRFERSRVLDTLPVALPASANGTQANGIAGKPNEALGLGPFAVRHVECHHGVTEVDAELHDDTPAIGVTDGDGDDLSPESNVEVEGSVGVGQGLVPCGLYGFAPPAQ
jgi:hypothetical protein